MNRNRWSRGDEVSVHDGVVRRGYFERYVRTPSGLGADVVLFDGDTWTGSTAYLKRPNAEVRFDNDGRVVP